MTTKTRPLEVTMKRFGENTEVWGAGDDDNALLLTLKGLVDEIDGSVMRKVSSGTEAVTRGC